MRAVLFGGRGQVDVAQRPAPTVRDDHDAVVRTTLSCICGSDLWAYRGVAERPAGQPLGHEFIGVVETVAAGVDTERLSLAEAEQFLAGIEDMVLEAAR